MKAAVRNIMGITIEVAPSDLRTNLVHLAWYLPIALAIGVVQLVFLSQPPWWDAVLPGLTGVGVVDMAIGVGAGLVLLLTGTVVKVLTRGGDAAWTYKALAAIEPGHRNIWSMASFAAILEETLFRAAVVPLIGLVPAAVLFAAAHFGTLLMAPTKGDAARAFVDILLFGLLIGWLFEAVGLVACIVAHLVHNVVALYHARVPWRRFHDDWVASRASSP